MRNSSIYWYVVACLSGLALFGTPCALAWHLYVIIRDAHVTLDLPPKWVFVVLVTMPTIFEICLGFGTIAVKGALKNARIGKPAPLRVRRAFWRVTACASGLAFIAAMLVVSRLAFPMLIGIVEGVGDGRFAAGLCSAIALTIWTGTGLVALTLIHLGREVSLAKACALRVAPCVAFDRNR